MFRSNGPPTNLIKQLRPESEKGFQAAPYRPPHRFNDKIEVEIKKMWKAAIIEECKAHGRLLSSWQGRKKPPFVYASTTVSRIKKQLPTGTRRRKSINFYITQNTLFRFTLGCQSSPKWRFAIRNFDPSMRQECSSKVVRRTVCFKLINYVWTSDDLFTFFSFFQKSADWNFLLIWFSF